MSNHTHNKTRRRTLQLGLTLAAGATVNATGLLAQSAPNNNPAEMRTKPILSSGEQIPMVGIGTARRYDVNPNNAEAMAQLREVIRLLPQLGGEMVDTAPSYGTAETVVGQLVEEVGNRDQLFFSTKVGAGRNGVEAGRAEIERSFERLRTDRIDLLQVHNLGGVYDMLPILREMKETGRIRYYGITTSFAGQYEEFEEVLANEPLDFIQVDYAIDNRSAGDRILPLAMERGVAVQTNLPFGRGRVFQAFGDQPVPDWVEPFGIETWAQFALKWIVSHPAVTAAIPGTATEEYLRDNLGASRGPLPDEATRQRMAALVDAA